jgi:hypothetical protein
MLETFRRYIPKSEVAALNAELTERVGNEAAGGESKQETTGRDGGIPPGDG